MKSLFFLIFIMTLSGEINFAFGINSNRQDRITNFKKVAVKKVEWAEQGILLDVPENLQEVKAEMNLEYETEETIGRMKRWREFPAQSKDYVFTVMIMIKESKTLPEKSPETSLQDLMSENLALYKIYERKPDVYAIIGGNKGIYSIWDDPETKDVQISWTTYRIYKGRFQKCWIGVGGKSHEKQKMTAIMDSVKFTQ